MGLSKLEKLAYTTKQEHMNIGNPQKYQKMTEWLKYRPKNLTEKVPTDGIQLFEKSSI
ncbi:hypothetical protein O204_22480 [Pseudomonas simiae]|uniref:Uncharacterized protein n=1 Tax=Pseudomonas simiae TaxID=321846 RepID=U1TMR3_9PSED|nr:hypothetical protein O204_22480 [Pseudomonas simiae]